MCLSQGNGAKNKAEGNSERFPRAFPVTLQSCRVKTVLLVLTRIGGILREKIN